MTENTGLDADLATLRRYALAAAFPVESRAEEVRSALDRVEAELSRLKFAEESLRQGDEQWAEVSRNQDRELARFREDVYREHRAVEGWSLRAEAAEARCARLQQALDSAIDGLRWQADYAGPDGRAEAFASIERARALAGDGIARKALAGLDTPAEEGS